MARIIIFTVTYLLTHNLFAAKVLGIPKDTATQTSLYLNCSGGGQNRTAVAYDGTNGRYYSSEGGSNGLKLETFNTSGTLLNTGSTDYDHRGLWYNTGTGQLEGNGYNTAGVRKLTLNGSFYATGASTSIYSTNNTSYINACASFDADSNEMVYSAGGAGTGFRRVSRSSNGTVSNVTLSGTPSGSSINSFTVMYTGVSGYEYAQFDYAKGRLLFYTTTGAYTGLCNLPLGTTKPSTVAIYYCNNLFWIFNSTTTKWQSYQVFYFFCPSMTGLSLSTTNVTCNGGSTGAAGVTITGSSTYSYLWSPGSQTTSSRSSLTAGTYYCTVSDTGTCTIEIKFNVTQPNAIANNTVSSAQTICTGSTPSGLTGTTPTGEVGSYTYLWQSSVTSSTAGFSSASGTNNTQNYSPGSLSQTTWYRRIVYSGSCTSNTSTAIAITVNTPGTWLGGTSTAWSNTANWTCPMVPDSSTNVTISSGATYMPVISDARTCNNLTIGSGATLTLDNAASKLSVSGTFSQNGTFTVTNGEMEFNGTAAQTIPAGSYSKLTINNASGTTLGGNVTVSGDVDLAGGRIRLDSYNLTLSGTTNSVTNSTGGSCIVTNGTGVLKIQNIGSGGRTGSVVFPVAHNNSSYNPVTLVNSGTSDEFGVSVIAGTNTAFSGTTATGTSITTNAVNRTWFVSEGTAGGSNVSITLQWLAGHELSGFTRNSCFVAHYTGGNWMATSASASSGSNPFTQTRTGITSFSPFGVSNLGGPLPVEWLSFTGKKVVDNVELSWVTATETNNSHFEVERSTDGRNFEQIGEVKGSGNSHTPINYNYTDVAPFGSNSILYYRLKQVDFNGEFDYSKTIAVSNNKQDNGVTIEAINPNPFTEKLNLTLTNVSEGNVTIEVYDLSGRKHYTQTTLSSGQGTLSIDLSSLANLAKGVYIVNIRNGNDAIQQKLVKLK
ncbi:MAG: T9SS type A sorting domain-containing protein [Bacteroidia bacterium]